MARDLSSNSPTFRNGGERPPHRRTLDIPYEVFVPVAYALVAALWIFFSDHILVAVAGSPGSLRLWSIIKGWAFVACTAMLLYVILQRIFSRIRSGQQQLVQSRQYLHRLLDASPLPIGVARLDGTIEYLNDRFVRTFGYEVADIPTVEAWAARAYPDRTWREQTLVDWHRRVQEAIAGRGEIVPMDVRITCKEGSVRDVVIHAAIMGDRLVTIFDDVTEQRQAERELQDKQRTMAIILDSISELFLYQTPDHRILWANRAAAESLGTTLEELTGRYCYTLWGQQEQECDGCPLRDVSVTGQPYEREITTPDGRQWAVKGYPIKDAQGHIETLVEVVLNITDRKQAEEQLRALNETLEQRVTERTALAEQRATELRALAQQLTQAEQKERRRIAQILHEHFQQLMVAAKFNTDLLRRHPGRSQGEALQKIDSALDEAIRVSRSLTVELSPPILYDLGLMQALCWLGRWMQERHGLRVEVRADPAAEPSDQDLRVTLFQAVRELLLNVIKHAGVDEARVEAAQRDGLLRITVADSGAGFDPSNRPERGDLTAGFGLFSIRERLALFGGRMEVETTPGHGTTITLVVPARLATAVTQEEQA